MPTAIDPIDPGQVLGDLERLKIGLATALSREEELDRVREQDRVMKSREITAQEKRDAENLEARVAEQVVIQKETIDQQQVAYELRLARIRQAYHSSRSTLAGMASSGSTRFWQAWKSARTLSLMHTAWSAKRHRVAKCWAKLRTSIPSQCSGTKSGRIS
jgi:hypothetical protein